MKRIEEFNVYSDTIPENMNSARKKILFLLHKHGMIERAPFMIKGVLLTTMRCAVYTMLNNGVIVNTKGFLSLTSKGIKMYSEAIESQSMVYVNLEIVVAELNKAVKPIGAFKICNNVFGKNHTGQHRYRVQVILKKLSNQGFVVVHSIKTTEKFYVLATSLKGKELLAAQAIQKKYREKDSLPYVFQKILTGMLTAGETKKEYLY